MLYMVIWTPVVGEMLVVKIEPQNRHDIHAVATYRDAESCRPLDVAIGSPVDFGSCDLCVCLSSSLSHKILTFWS